MNPSTLLNPLFSRGRFTALRLGPGEEVLARLQRFVHDQGLAAVAVASCVGSLTTAAIRYANREDVTLLEGHFEIVSMIGTLEAAPSQEDPQLGGAHVHIAVSDGEGAMRGGHMMSGCRVYTTLEIVLLVLDDVDFVREPCLKSGYPELVIRAAARRGQQPAQMNKEGKDEA